MYFSSQIFLTSISLLVNVQYSSSFIPSSNILSHSRSAFLHPYKRRRIRDWPWRISSKTPISPKMIRIQTNLKKNIYISLCIIHTQWYGSNFPLCSWITSNYTLSIDSQIPRNPLLYALILTFSLSWKF